MRIAFVTFEFPPHVVGGAGVYAAQLTASLAKIGHEIVGFTPVPSSQSLQIERPDNGEVDTVDTPAPGAPRTIQFWTKLPKAIREIAASSGFVVIHVNS